MCVGFPNKHLGHRIAASPVAIIQALFWFLSVYHIHLTQFMPRSPPKQTSVVRWRRFPAQVHGSVNRRSHVTDTQRDAARAQILSKSGPMSSDDRSTTDSWASTTDSFDTTSDSGSDSSDGGLNFAHLAAQVAGLVVADADGPGDDNDEDSWLRRANRPQTLAAARLLLEGRRFVHEIRFTPEQFEYLCTKLEVPDIIPTQDQRLHSSTCVFVCRIDVLPTHPTHLSLTPTHPLSTHPPHNAQDAEDQAAGGQVRLPPHRQPPRASRRGPGPAGEQVGLPPDGGLQVHDRVRRLAHGPVRGRLGMGMGKTIQLSHSLSYTTTRWGHLLTFTAGRVGPRVPAYAQAVGEKIGLDDPAQNRVFGFIDGIFLCVPFVCCLGLGHGLVVRPS